MGSNDADDDADAVARYVARGHDRRSRLRMGSDGVLKGQRRRHLFNFSARQYMRIKVMN